MNKYDPKAVEPKWQKFWEDNQTFRAETDPSKEKFFGLIEFPYPSGAGLHVGHPRSYTAMDVITRQKRMEGKNVLYPIGFDSFGLPTENFAIKTGRPPAEITDENIANFTRQLKALGFGFDWSRAVTTSEPEYYKWTQWIFLQLYKHGLAYKANQPINWCPKDKIGLANEEVVDGCCERCGNPVEKRNKEQWMLAITKYADKLLAGLNEVDYISRAKIQQENWIGRSEGAEINFSIKDSEQKIKVFTTRPDTIFGVTFLAVSAEWAEKWFADKQASTEITNYIAATLQGRTTAVAREEVEKTGIDSGIVAVNPLSGEEIPVWIVNYVLADVGTGAIMAVPAHDERDYEFAQKFNLPVKQVVAPYVKLSGALTPQLEKKTTKKRVVSAIVKHAETGDYLLLTWPGTSTGLVGGGVDEGEDELTAIVREIAEETGYKNAVIKSVVLPALYGHGYKPRKDVNCFDLDTFYFAEVSENNKGEIRTEDQGAHQVSWVKENEVSKKLTQDHHSFAWNWYKENKKCLTDGGIAINSDFLNELTTVEAKEKMVSWLEEKGIGNRKVQFKLRDWVFSRQRYWGEPIPLVFCENCADKKYNVIIVHGFGSKSSTGFKPWLKEELEKQGHTVWSPDLPNTTTPNINEQTEFIIHNAPFKIDGHTILVGCSLGGVVMYKLLEKLTAPIAKVVFVDPVVKPEYNDREPREAVLDSCDWKFNWEKIREHASERIILADVNYPIIKKEHLEELNKNIHGRLVVRLPNVPHFSSVKGALSKEPVVLEEVLRSDCGQIVELKKASVWNRLVNGTKTAKGFAFGNKQTRVELKVGGLLTFVHDSETRSAEIIKVHEFKSLSDLAGATELHEKLFDTAAPLTEAELTKLYSEYNPNYPEYIAETGLVVCEFKLQPVKYKNNSGWIPLPASELPLELPKVEKYLPTDTGESPLAAMTDWVKTKCPKCGGEARRETDTMPNWAGSSWYFLRYMDPQNAKNLFTVNGFKFRAAIEPTEKDKTYFATFKQIYQDLEKQNIKVWAGNRLLLNGLNRNLWTELRTVCLVAWNDDKAAIANYLLEQGYTLTQSFNQNDLYEKAGVRVEIVPVWKENGEMYSLTYQGAKQPMQARDLPEVLMGHLWGFSFRIISPEYNLAHYEYTEKHESDGQSNQEKIAFLSEWVEKINPNIRYWNQVDWYNGGMEHTVLHLLYSRFWNQFLYDIGVVPTLEPYKKRTSHGMILAKGGEKMSKSKGNVVNPDEMVELYGADALRTYIMFMGPFDQAVEWDTNGLVGVRRFLDKVWNLQEKVSDSAETNKKVVTQLHQTIKKVTDDIANMSFNTPVAKLMELVNALSSEEQIAKTDYQILIKLVSVFAPHIGEELWSMFGTGGSVALATWPVYDASLAKDSEVTVAVQVNGKVRTELVVSPDIAEEEMKALALANENIQKWLEGKEPKKVIYVKGRLVSIVV